MTVIFVGDEEIVRRLKNIEDMRPIKLGLRAGAMHIAGKIAVYPAASEANMPRTEAATGRVLPWYERNYGTRWYRKNGTLGGRKTSEMLGKSWTRKSMYGGLTQIIGNDASYGPYVQGEEQAAFHKARGWKTTDTVVEEETAAVMQFIYKYVVRELDGRPGA